MFPYRVKYTESEYDLQDNNLLYKIHQQCQNTFELLEFFRKRKKRKYKKRKCYLYKLHNLYFVNFGFLKMLQML